MIVFYNGKVTLDEIDKNQSNLLSNDAEFNSRGRPKANIRWTKTRCLLRYLIIYLMIYKILKILVNALYQGKEMALDDFKFEIFS